MKEIPEEQVVRRIKAENPWWQPPHTILDSEQKLPRRAYLDLFQPLVVQREVRRAAILLGPRRVGKTVLIHHAIHELLTSGIAPTEIVYFSVDHPLYNGLGLEELLALYGKASGIDYEREPAFAFFDEIQYLKDWETHLKALVDGYPHLRFIASGSAAAALRMKSLESGAGRFTDFLLPPLTFHEYLMILGKEDRLVQTEEPQKPGTRSYSAPDIDQLNTAFVHYLNFGGYPEVVLSEAIQADPARFIKADIIDKVLLRDLPSLYGIQDIQELNSLFTTLAYNTADEVSLESLSQGSGVAKNTLKRYIEYLEAAFLIKVVHRIDRAGRSFQRANFFKVYLTNPSMRSALFAPLSADDEAIGSLAETGILSQWFHSTQPLRYARWHHGEVDIVLTAGSRVVWAVEVKWSDRIVNHPEELKSLLTFCKQNRLDKTLVTTRSTSRRRTIEGIDVQFTPASLYCYTVGRNLIEGRGRLGTIGDLQPPQGPPAEPPAARKDS